MAIVYIRRYTPSTLREPAMTHRFLFPLLAFTVVGCGPKPSPPAVAPALVVAPPGEAKADDSAARETAMKNLRAIGQALYGYEQVAGQFPPASATADGKGLSWRVQILPHLGKEGQELYAKFHPQEAWDGPHNKAVIDQMPAVYTSPGRPAEKGQTYLRGFVGQTAFFLPDDTTRTIRGRPIVNGFQDGLANTLVVAEAAEPVVWTKPDELVCDGKTPPKLGGVFAGGFHGLLADADALWFPEKTPEATLRALLTVSGGEVIDFTPIRYPNGVPTPKEPPAAVPDALPDAAARRTAVQRMHAVAKAWHEYHDANHFFPAGVVGPGGTAGLSWRVQLLPHLGQGDLYKQFKLNEPWDSEHNKKLVEQMPDVFASAGKPAEKGHTLLRTTRGPDGVVFTQFLGPGGKPLPVTGEPGQPVRGRTLHSFADGPSNSILFAEAGTVVPWTKPDELDLPHAPMNQQTTPGIKRVVPPNLGGAFAGGFHAATANGMVVFYKSSLPPTQLGYLLTISGGEVIDSSVYEHTLYALPPPK